ncbi:MAG: YbbR-like domain-containing protein [Polaribacter sp.]
MPVTYTNIPQDKLLQKEPTKELDIEVKTTGFKILKSRISKNEIALNANNLIRKTSSKYYFLTRNQHNNIQKQLYSGVVLQNIELDTIYLEIGSLISKKVPLKPNLDINYHIGYDVLEMVIIKPDSIVISGPESQIKKIKKIDLELLKLDDVKSDFKEEVKIVLPKNSKSLKVTTDFTVISGKVEKFTEGTFDIPFKVINLPDDMELTTLNETVEVVFVVGLSNFNKIDKNFFEVICDYNTTKENNLSYLLPKVVVKSNLIKSYKVVPNKIDFLIQK